MKTYTFENLEVWQKSRLLVNDVYIITKGFPVDERFGMTQQIRRACISVTCNLAEGTSRITGKEQARFTEISFGSLMEVLNLLIAGMDLNYLDEPSLISIRPLIEEIGNKLHALRNAQLKRA